MPYGALAVLAVAVLAAYAPAISNELVWDDRDHIVRPGQPAGVADAIAHFRTPHGAYHRPFVFLTYAVERAVWGTAPRGYHLVNLLLHLANTLLLIVLARRTGVPPRAAVVGAAVFALHPIQTEAVAYVSGRTDLLMTAGALASGALLLGSGPALMRGVAAAGAGAAAMLSKESGYALVLLWPWWASRRGGDRAAAVALALPGIVAACLLLWLRAGDLPAPVFALDLHHLAAVGRALAMYAGLLVWPLDLQVDRLTPVAGGVGAAAGLAVLAGALAAAGWGLTRSRAVGDWTAWTVAFYLPVSNLVALYPAIAARALFTPEHNLYAPLAGLGVLAGIGVERIALRTAPARRRAGAVAIVAVLAAWAVLTAARCTAWRSEERLFGAAVAAGSRSPRVWYNYGNALLERGALAEAVAAFGGATARAPHDAAAWMNLGVALQRQRSYAAAERAYRTAAELAPADAHVLENLGTLHLARGDREAARRAFTAALRIDPARPLSRRALEAIK